MADQVPNGAMATATQDVEMKEEEAPPASTLQSIPDPPADTLPAPLPAAAATPPALSSSASAVRPGSMPPQPVAKPDKPVAHGGPTRQYLNQNVTPHLLEAMKYLAAYEPEKPLLWLSEFMRDRSSKVE